MCFETILGNDPVKQYLKRALQCNSMANTLLFSGPDGVGKSLFAKGLACQLMYPEGVDQYTKQRIDQENHPDMHVYSPEGKVGMHSIASVRDLIHQVYMAPFEAKAKVFIIHDAERMMPASANALLKTLEEPTFDSYIILLSSKADNLLPTIISRCAKLSFTYLSEGDIIAVAKTWNKTESEAKQLAVLAGGSIGYAWDLANSLNFKKKKQSLLEMLAREKSADYITFDKSLKQLEDFYSKEKYVKEEDFILWYKEVEELFSSIFMWYRDLWLIKHQVDTKFLFFSDYLYLLEKQNLFSLLSLQTVEKYIDEARLGIARNIKLRTCLESLFLKLGTF